MHEILFDDKTGRYKIFHTDNGRWSKIDQLTIKEMSMEIAYNSMNTGGSGFHKGDIVIACRRQCFSIGELLNSANGIATMKVVMHAFPSTDTYLMSIVDTFQTIVNCDIMSASLKLKHLSRLYLAKNLPDMSIIGQEPLAQDLLDYVKARMQA